ncbi:MAG: pilus assembly protein CpaC [Caulobacterales bacterium 68-7]|nr:type II and III secretion system protein family protein [Caulobacterales bacterium]OJU09696.1 MAG: pilus assembly protein CpaC [Caulobacterales bacterium 68-7]
MIRRINFLARLLLTAVLAGAPLASAVADGPAVAPVRRAAPPPVMEQVAAAPAPVSVLRVDLSSNGSRSLAIPLGKSAIVELPVDVRDMMVTNPDIADAVIRTPRRIYVLGVKTGQTDAVFFDAAGRRILSLDIRVDLDVAAIGETIRRVLPGSQVRAEGVNGGVILSGLVMTASDSDRATRIAQQFVGKPENVLNMLSIAGKDQVMLKVRIVEVQRNIIKQLGFNSNAILNQIGEPQYSLGFTPTYGVNGGLLGGAAAGFNLDTTQGPVMQRPCGYPAPNEEVMCDFIVRSGGNADTATIKKDLIGDPGLNKASAMMQAFERVGLVRTLAEPNLTVVSGEAGKFLVGGEFPVPVGQDTTGRVSLEFKPYGIGLGYTPVVMSGGRISLKLSTEVSELSSLGAYNLVSGNTTLTVPGLSVRRAETTVELPSGGSLMIAGLLHQQSKQNIDALPGMTSLPVLGALFRSRDYLNGETELVVIITPYLVDAQSADRLQTPADGLRIASDPETVLLGRLNTVVQAARSNSAPGVPASRPYQGPIGYVIE